MNQQNPITRTGSILPNRMPFTNPGSVSNSGNSYFTNQESKIYKLNLHILENADEISIFLNNSNTQSNNSNSNQNSNSPSDANFEDILYEQKNNVKMNKLNKNLPPLLN